MRDSDWSRRNLLRSDWLLPSVASLTTKNEERESKTARKMAQVKERGGGGRESRSSFFLCSETKRKRLLRRLAISVSNNGLV